MFAELVKIVKNHHQPPPSTIVQRFYINTRIQEIEEETVSEFVAGLHRLSEYCQFAATLDDMLRDRLVCGIRDCRFQQRLLAETDLTFQKALDISQAIEAAERNTRDLQAKQTPKPTLALYQPTRRLYSQGLPKSSDSQTKCYRCGSSHQARECPFKDAEYHYCKRKGHIAKVCRTKARDEGNKMAHKTHQVIEAIEDSHNEGLGDVTYSLYKMTSRKCDPIMTMAANRIFLRNLHIFWYLP